VRPRRQDGFTLLEVMIALAILITALVVVLRMAATDVRATHKAKMLTIATQLARGKLLDVEEELLHNGFQETSETMEGNFDEEGQPRFKWSAVAEKVELPTVDQLKAGQGKEGEQPAPAAPMSGAAAGQEAGISIAQMYFPMVQPILEQAIRKVSLTVTWTIGKGEEKLTVICFFTDTKAIEQAGELPGGMAGGTTK